MKHITRNILSLAMVLAFSIGASADIVHLKVDMDGPQANAGAGSGSPGLGEAVLVLDTANGALTWDITWSGLIGAETSMHFHGPALPNQNAGVQVGVGVLGPPVVSNGILNPGQVADILAGLWYLNLHTTNSPGGEIRGQVVTTCAPMASSEERRLGVPANPNVFLPGLTSGPVIGQIWDPVVDHSSFFPGAIIDLLVVSFGGPVNVPIGPSGTLLCDITVGTPKTFTTPAGVPFALLVPEICALVGLPICTQVASLDAQDFFLTNALDIQIGTF